MGPSTIHVLHLASAKGAAALDGERILRTCRGLEDHGGTREFRGSVAIIRPAGMQEQWADEARHQGVDFYDVRRFGPFDPTLWFRLARLIKKLSIDIVHTYDRESRGWALVLQPRFRFRMIAKAFEPEAVTWGEKLSREIDHKLLPGFDRVIAANAQLARQLCQLGCRINQIDVIPEATDEQVSGQGVADSIRLREQLVIPEQASIVGMYLDGVDVAGAKRMAEAVRYAQGRLGPLYTLGIGPDVARSEIRTALLRSGLAPRLRMYDIGENLPRVCHAVDAMLVAGSKAGPATLEAQASGASVVATMSTGADGMAVKEIEGLIVAEDVTSEIGAALIQGLGKKRPIVAKAIPRTITVDPPAYTAESMDRLVHSYRRAMLV